MSLEYTLERDKKIRQAVLRGNGTEMVKYGIKREDFAEITDRVLRYYANKPERFVEDEVGPTDISRRNQDVLGLNKSPYHQSVASTFNPMTYQLDINALGRDLRKTWTAEHDPKDIGYTAEVFSKMYSVPVTKIMYDAEKAMQSDKSKLQLTFDFANDNDK